MNNQYKTKDLAEAAALIVVGKNLVSIERQEGICFFIFEEKNDCQNISSRFFFGELLVNARDYHNALGRLKNRIFSR